MFGGVLDGCAIIVIDGQTADDAVICTFQQFYDTMLHLASVIVVHHGLAAEFCQLDDGAVALFAHQYDVRSVDDDFLLIHPLADENLIGLVRLSGGTLDGSLYALACRDDGIEIGIVDFRLAIHLDGAVLVGALGLKTDEYFMLRIVLGSPFLVKGEQGSNAVDKPSVAVATLMTYLFQSATWYAVSVANERFAAFQIVIACPDGGSRRVFLQPCLAVSSCPAACATDAQSRQLVFVEPPHGSMDGALDTLVGVGQTHQQAGDAPALGRSVRR